VKRSANCDEMLLAAWEWVGEMGAAHGCATRVVLVPRALVGCWEIRAEAVDCVEGRGVRVISQVVQRYDSERGTRALSATIWDMLRRLDAEVTKSSPSAEATQ